MNKLNELNDEFWNFILKTLPFSMAALAISVGIQIKNKTATVINVLLSIVIGISCAYLTGGLINKNFGSSTAPIIIGIVTISGEKVGYWLIYKLNVDLLMESILKALVKKFKK